MTSRKRSEVWEYFSQDDTAFATCLVCADKVKRGKEDVKLLLYQLNKLPRRGVCRLTAKLISETDKYFGGSDQRENFVDIELTEVYTLSTLLDPRFRKTAFSCNQKAESAAKLLLEKVTGQITNESQREDPNPAVDADEDNDWVACMQ